MVRFYFIFEVQSTSQGHNISSPFFSGNTLHIRQCLFSVTEFYLFIYFTNTSNKMYSGIEDVKRCGHQWFELVHAA